MKYLLLLIIFTSISCSTVAIQSDDGKVLKIKGIGKAKFENGAEIEGRPLIEMPKLPDIEFKD